MKIRSSWASPLLALLCAWPLLGMTAPEAPAEQSDEALMKLGLMNLNGEIAGASDSTAYQIFLRLANRGNTQAQRLVAHALVSGRGVERDRHQAFLWTQKAAELDDPIAMYQLGQMYGAGFTVPADDSKANLWLQRAAEKGEGHAQLALGERFEKGLGRKRSVVVAQALYALAAGKAFTLSDQAAIASVRLANSLSDAQIAAAQDLKSRITEIGLTPALSEFETRNP